MLKSGRQPADKTVEARPGDLSMVARTRAGGNPLGTLGRGRLKGQTGRQPRAITRKSIPNRDWPLALTPVWVLRQAASLAPCHPRRPGSRGGVDDIVGTCLADALNDARQRQTVCPEELESHHQAVPHALRVGKPAPPVHGPEKYFGVNLDDARISGERLDLEDPPAKSVTLLGNGGTQVAHNLHRFTVISRLQGPTRRREKHAVAPLPRTSRGNLARQLPYQLVTYSRLRTREASRPNSTSPIRQVAAGPRWRGWPGTPRLSTSPPA
jgi:hypothetical protein